MTKHAVKPLPYANDAVKGIGAKTMEIHHDKLYAGYVNKRNEIEEALGKVDRSKANQIYSEIRGLKHEETFAANGQILHEIYFSIMGGDGQPKGEVVDKIKEDFGTFAAWEEDFKASAMCARGWVVLAYDPDRRPPPQLHRRRAESGRRLGHVPGPELRHLRALLLHRLRQ